MHFEIYIDRNQQYRFRLIAANGEIIVTGEGYEQRKNCYKAIALIKESFAAPVKLVIPAPAKGE